MMAVQGTAQGAFQVISTTVCLSVYPDGKGQDNEKYDPSYCMSCKRTRQCFENQLTN